MSSYTSHSNGTSPNTISETFNEATGDFALVTSDNIVFYVPRAVLQLSSKVFETMFEAGTPSAEDKAPIQVQADAKHLEMILRFAHPSLVSPQVTSVTSLAELLRIAKQYQMDGVLGHLREWLLRIGVTKSGIIEPISKREPLTAFVLAISFDCVEEARHVLRELIKCDLHQELDAAAGLYEIPLYLMQLIVKLRTERAAFWMLRATQLSQAVIKSCMAVSHTSTAYSMAVSHSSECTQWQRSTSKALHKKPSFSTLKSLIYNSATGKSAEGFLERSDLFLTLYQCMMKWEFEAADIESRLPELTLIGA